MIIADSNFAGYAHARGLRLRGLQGFGLPPLKDHIKYTVKYDSNKMMTHTRLLARFNKDGPSAAFENRWNKAIQIANEIHQIKHEPEARGLASREQALDNSLMVALTSIARNAEMDIQSAATSNAVYRASDILNEYLGPLFDDLQRVKAAVANRRQLEIDRAAAQERAVTAAADRAREEEVERRLRAEGGAAEAQVVINTTKKEVYATEKAVFKAKEELDKYVDYVQANKILGIPVSYWIGAGVIAAGVGTYTYIKRKKRRKG